MKQIYNSKHTFGLMGLLYFTLHYELIAFKNQNVVSECEYSHKKIKLSKGRVKKFSPSNYSRLVH